jgi:hypothetical protein
MKLWIGLAWLKIKIGILNKWGMKGMTGFVWLEIKFVSYKSGTGVCEFDSRGSGQKSAFEKWNMRMSTASPGSESRSIF